VHAACDSEQTSGADAPKMHSNERKNPMNSMHTTTRHLAASLIAGLLLAPAMAAEPRAASAAQAEAAARYEKERAACLDGTSQQERSACLKEAGAALAEARRARLGSAEDAAALRRNAVQRCEAVRAEDRESCRAMALGEGTVSGSAAAGGVIKELVTIEPAASAPPR
jgi:hypothetical protein